MPLDTEWKDCGKHIAEYRVVVLPRGNSESHAEFRIDPNRAFGGSSARKSGRPKAEPTQEKLQQDLFTKEQKVLTEKIETD